MAQTPIQKSISNYGTNLKVCKLCSTKWVPQSQNNRESGRAQINHYIPIKWVPQSQNNRVWEGPNKPLSSQSNGFFEARTIESGRAQINHYLPNQMGASKPEQ